MNKYEATIGLEIHAELKTQSKMFCSCRNIANGVSHIANCNDDKQSAISDKPNWNVCPVCLGMPGMLPVLNRQAVEWTILTGLALNCKIGHQRDLRGNSQSAPSALYTKWDRKNYFYPDLPKGYQISQYDLPIASNGWLKLKTKNEKLKTIGITRIHLEEDTGTSKHPEGRAEVDYSLMDYNRAGVPLMELVTEPDIQSAKEAKEFCQKYQLILRYLGVADADMEKGQLRCEVNISLREITRMDANKEHELTPNKLGTKVEIKNLNSFKSVEKAIEYEIGRQSELLDSGGKIIQETRGWDDAKNKTYTMRIKETSADYRYFPEPDLPPVIIQNSKCKIQNDNSKCKIINIEEIRKQLPELPDEKLERFIRGYQLKPADVEVIVNNLEMMRYFEKIVKLLNGQIVKIRLATNWLINEISDLSIKPEYLVELVSLIEENKITAKTAKEILPEIREGKSPSSIIKEKGLGQISDESAIEKIVDQVLSKNPAIVEKIKSGQTQVIGFLVGQVMRQSKGQANPQIVNEILRKKIK